MFGVCQAHIIRLFQCLAPVRFQCLSIFDTSQEQQQVRKVENVCDFPRDTARSRMQEYMAVQQATANHHSSALHSKSLVRLTLAKAPANSASTTGPAPQTNVNVINRW